MTAVARPMARTVAREGALVSPLFLGALFTATFVKIQCVAASREFSWA